MRNIETVLSGTTLVIKIDVSQPGEASASGKSMVIASTEGNADVVQVPGLKLGINLFRALPKAPKAAK